MRVLPLRGERTKLAGLTGNVWVCGVEDASSEVTVCIVLDPLLGKQTGKYLFQWTAVSSMLQTKDTTRVLLSGHTITDSTISSDIASCVKVDTQLVCMVKSFAGTLLVAGTYESFADKLIHVGAMNTLYPTIAVSDGAAGDVRSFIYTSTDMRTISLLQVQSPPNFIGAFIAGTCVNSAGINYIYAGMVRTDSGVMTGMYISPTSGNIRNSAELVNTMVLESLGPDSFIAGGLELSDGTGIQAYLVRANSLYRKVVYGVRYTIHNTLQAEARKLLQGDATAGFAIKTMVLVEASLYMIINRNMAGSGGNRNSFTVLKTDILSGNILQQVHIHSHNASIRCTDISTAGLFLFIACAVQHPDNTTESIVMTVDRGLTFSKLPEGFTRLEETVFVAESVAFKGTVLPLTMSSDNRIPSEYTYNTEDVSPTLLPSVAPTSPPSLQSSSAPSGQPSSSPTSTPSVSPQPTSQPSSSGPTNTYKPTVKPTQQPTSVPSAEWTSAPTHVPTFRPTSRPSLSPSLTPSISPSTKPSSARPTQAPSARPTRSPSARYTRTPTVTPSIPSTTSPTQGISQEEKRRNQARVSAMLGYAVAGLFGLGLMYQLFRWCRYKVPKVKEDKKRVKEMLAQDLPGKLRYPIFTATAALCCSLEVEEPEPEPKQGESARNADTADYAVPSTGAFSDSHDTYTGQGANMDGPASFMDLESNMRLDSDRNTMKRGGGKETNNRKEKAQETTVLPEAPTKIPIVHGETEDRRGVPAEPTFITPVEDTSDFSNASDLSSSEESSEDSDSAVEERLAILPVKAAHKGPSTAVDWCEFEPSDDSDVVYSISSESAAED